MPRNEEAERTPAERRPFEAALEVRLRHMNWARPSDDVKRRSLEEIWRRVGGRPATD